MEALSQGKPSLRTSSLIEEKGTYVYLLEFQPLFVERLIVDFLKVFLDVLELKSHDLLVI